MPSQGDIFIYDNTTGKTRQITKTSDAELNPRFLPDGKRISFTRANNLYVMPLDGGMLVQVTDVRAAAAAGSSGCAGSGTGRTAVDGAVVERLQQRRREMRPRAPRARST